MTDKEKLDIITNEYAEALKELYVLRDANKAKGQRLAKIAGILHDQFPARLYDHIKEEEGLKWADAKYKDGTSAWFYNDLDHDLYEALYNSAELESMREVARRDYLFSEHEEDE